VLTGSPLRRWLDAGALLVMIALATSLVVRGGELTDLHVYQYAGRTLLDGGSPYAAHDPVTGLPFTYPPFAAVVMVPLAVLPFDATAVLWTGVSVAALAAAVALAMRSLGREAPGWLVALLAVAALAAEPVWQNLTFGQVNLVLMLALLVDVLQPDRRWSGVLVGIAAGVKLTPLVFVVLLVLVGRRNAAGRALVAFAATVAVGWVLVPDSSVYWGDRLVEPSRVGPPALAHNQSVYGALTRLLDREPSTALWLAVAVPVAALALAVAALWWRRGDRLLGTSLCALAMLVASPVSWSHHWVWAVPLVLALWAKARWCALACVAVFVARPFVWLPYGQGREYDWAWWQHVAGDAYVCCALGLVLWAAQAASPKTTTGLPGIRVGGQSQVSSQGR
jgi:alpha-1,2-mannosyltransferase